VQIVAQSVPVQQTYVEIAAGAKSGPYSQGPMDELPSPFVPEILPKPIYTDGRVSLSKSGIAAAFGFGGSPTNPFADGQQRSGLSTRRD